MKNKTLISGILFATIIFIFSCGERYPNSPFDKEPHLQSSEYFPLTVGSWWVYEGYELDTNLQPIKLNFKDSITVVCDTVYYNELCTKFLRKRTLVSGKIMEKNLYYYSDNNNLFQYKRYAQVGYMDSLWQIEADFGDNKEYIILDTIVSGDMYGIEYKNSFQLTDFINLNLRGIEYRAIGIRRSYYKKGFMTDATGMPIPLATIDSKTYDYYSKSIGLVYSVDTSGLRETILVDYKIK
ncbi:MAG: hypothetical protein V1779_14125 [bacterium]